MERIIDWFLNSKIYARNQGYRVYYSNSEESPPYPEITAYAISLACILYKREGDPTFLKRAEECAHVLEGVSMDGGIPSHDDNCLYSFDTGIYISGLLDLHALTKKPAYLREAKKSLTWLKMHFDGEKFAATNKNPERGKWEKYPSIHLTKLAIPLIKAWHYLKIRECKEMAVRLLSWAEKLQLDNGAFRINDHVNKIMTHPHCYATEGFLFAYHYLREEEYLVTAKKASKWLSSIQNKDGSFYRWYPPAVWSRMYVEKVSDALAQAARIWKVLGTNREGTDKASRYLEGIISKGGLPLVKRKFIFFEKTDSRIYSWPTFFYLHSLLLPRDDMRYCEEIF